MAGARAHCCLLAPAGTHPLPPPPRTSPVTGPGTEASATPWKKQGPLLAGILPWTAPFLLLLAKPQRLPGDWGARDSDSGLAGGGARGGGGGARLLGICAWWQLARLWSEALPAALPGKCDFPLSEADCAVWKLALFGARGGCAGVGRAGARGRPRWPLE